MACALFSWASRTNDSSFSTRHQVLLCISTSHFCFTTTVPYSIGISLDTVGSHAVRLQHGLYRFGFWDCVAPLQMTINSSHRSLPFSSFTDTDHFLASRSLPSRWTSLQHLLSDGGIGSFGYVIGDQHREASQHFDPNFPAANRKEASGDQGIRE